MVIEKLCPRCKETKYTTEFGNNKSMKDGLTQYCKACTKAWRKNYFGTDKGKKYKNRHNVRSLQKLINKIQGTI